MDHHAALTHPLDGVFRRLATPACLGDWLPEVACVRAGPVPPASATCSAWPSAPTATRRPRPGS